MKLRNIPRYLCNPKRAIESLRLKYNDRYAIEQQWMSRNGYPLNLDNPQSYCEKLNWIKLYDRNPQYTLMADKYQVKKFVAEKIGSKYVIPTLAVYKSVDEIDLDKLPDQFVLKCNHDSGSTIVCTDKSKFDLEQAKEKLKKALSIQYFYFSQEWPYKNIPRRIIAEQYIEPELQYDESGNVIKDSEDLWTYKFICTNGIPRIMYITVKNGEVWENYYDMEYKPLEISTVFRQSTIPTPKPECWEELKQIAARLTEGIPHVRCDLYVIRGQIYFSEFTFFNWGGWMPFKPEKWNKIIGDWIELPAKK